MISVYRSYGHLTYLIKIVLISEMVMAVPADILRDQMIGILVWIRYPDFIAFRTAFAHNAVLSLSIMIQKVRVRYAIEITYLAEIVKWRILQMLGEGAWSLEDSIAGVTVDPTGTHVAAAADPMVFGVDCCTDSMGEIGWLLLLLLWWLCSCIEGWKRVLTFGGHSFLGRAALYFSLIPW